ncbi:MAG: hypothetical protein EP330_23665 [Deltaproteobacteria bacterium]|nr:MAG: hypothetical protein EP330_23665 [Deltaproteobacteria bacterium]
MLTLLLALSAHALPPYAAPDRPPAEVAVEDPFAWHTTYDAEHTRIVATLTIPEGHTVYRDQVEIDVVDGGGAVLGKPDLPKGEVRPDPAGRAPRELYAADLVVFLPVKRGDGVVKLSLRHQGCKGGLCFAPVTQERLVQVGAPGPAPR